MNVVPAIRRHFYAGAASVLLAITLVGFAPSFFLEPVFGTPAMIAQVAGELAQAEGRPDVVDPGLPLYVVAHGVIATAWMVLFLAQTLLIAFRRPATHKRLGVAGLVLAAGVVTSGVYALYHSLPRLIALADLPDPAAVVILQLPAMAGDLGSFTTFALAVAAAAYFRARPDTHKQLMLLASMTLISPAIARTWLNLGVAGALEVWLPTTEFVLAAVFIGGAWVARRRAPWVLIGGLIFWIVLYGVMTGVGSTPAAQAWALGSLRG